MWCNWHKEMPQANFLTSSQIKDLSRKSKQTLLTRHLEYSFTAWKVSKYGVISGPYFPAFGLITERYELSLRIQSECGKIRTWNNSYLDTFHAVINAYFDQMFSKTLCKLVFKFLQAYGKWAFSEFALLKEQMDLEAILNIFVVIWKMFNQTRTISVEIWTRNLHCVVNATIKVWILHHLG